MATYYWVGGSGTWDNVSATNWAASSGGAGGAGIPNGTDTVIFDAGSGSGTCTTVATAACSVATLNSATVALVLGANLTMSGVFTLTQGSVNLSSFVLTALSFASNNANTRSIAFGAAGSIKTTVQALTAWDIRDLTGFSCSGSRQVVIQPASGVIGTTIYHRGAGASEARAVSFKIVAPSGEFTFANTNIALDLDLSGFASAAALPNSTYTIYGSLTLNALNVFTAGANAWTFAATSGGKQITTNGVVLDHPLVFNGIGGTFAFQDALTQGSTHAFTIANGTVKLKNGVTSTVGAFTTSGTNQKFLESTLAGSRATLSQASGTVSASYLTIKDISSTGGATWNAFTTSNNVDAGNNLGWDFSTQIGRYIFTTRKNKRILS